MTTNLSKKLQTNRDWVTHYHQNPMNAEFLIYADYYANILKEHKKILIIEDDFFSFEVMQAFVGEYDKGLTCFFASNEADALDIMSRYNCDLVIADYFLNNNETGLSICQKIREHNQRVSFLIVSSLKSYQYQEILKYSNFEPAFLEKPVSKTKIVSYLTEVYGVNETG